MLGKRSGIPPHAKRICGTGAGAKRAIEEPANGVALCIRVVRIVVCGGVAMRRVDISKQILISAHACLMEHDTHDRHVQCL